MTTGERRSFGISASRALVEVPYPSPEPDWTARTITCGVALQCSPSKDGLAGYPAHELSRREIAALTIAEAEVALAWVAAEWPGLGAELSRRLPDLEPSDIAAADYGEQDVSPIVARAVALARSERPLTRPPLVGRLPLAGRSARGLRASLSRGRERLPWSAKRTDGLRRYSSPVGGDGGLRNIDMAPPSRPDDEEIEIRPDQRAGIPYPEWSVWAQRLLPDHVAVLERRHPGTEHRGTRTDSDVRKWFEEHTHRVMTGRLEDGSDLDIDSYVAHHVATVRNEVTDGRVFRDLLPGTRDVATALLLDGSSSLGVDAGRAFQLELSCADALSRAMTLARERHGIFVFSGNTRHRVEVLCLKDFHERRLVAVSSLGLGTGGYTRLGAPLRHLVNRLLDQPSERRLLIVIGDGLMSDEGYEGRYAWADVAHAVEEAEQAGVLLYYVGLGSPRVDPLPEVFGNRRSLRITRVEELPRALAHVHRRLLGA